MTYEFIQDLLALPKVAETVLPYAPQRPEVRHDPRWCAVPYVQSDADVLRHTYPSPDGLSIAIVFARLEPD